jgi:hypothetical protein
MRMSYSMSGESFCVLDRSEKSKVAVLADCTYQCQFRAKADATSGRNTSFDTTNCYTNKNYSGTNALPGAAWRASKTSKRFMRYFKEVSETRYLLLEV